MKEYHRSNICRLISSDKKKSKIKTRKKENDCKCLTPCSKVHHYHCPLIRHPCPVHGRHGDKEKKVSSVDQDDRMIVSFHPSLQTDRLFHPVKELLTRKSPDTKISFQYYSPAEDSNYKSCEIQTNSRDFKNIDPNYFLEKTKSLSEEKKSQMKKIKHNFCLANTLLSPKKTRSQISVKENIIKGIFSEAKKTKDVSVSVSSERFFKNKKIDNENFSPIWYCCNKFESSDGEKSFIPESDFLTVTQHLHEENHLYHKIFEIKHKKGSNEFPNFKTKKKLSEIAPQVYFAGIENNDCKSKSNPFKKNLFVKKNDTKAYSRPPWEHQNNSKEFHEKETKNNNSKELISDKSQTQTDSSGSVYYTPFILLPKETNDHGHEIKKKKVTDREVQTGLHCEEIKPQKSRHSTSSEASQVSQEINKIDYKSDSPEVIRRTSSITEESHIGPRKIDSAVMTPIKREISPREPPPNQFFMDLPQKSSRACTKRNKIEVESQTEPMRRNSMKDKSVGTTIVNINVHLVDKSSMAKPKYSHKAVQYPGSCTEVISMKSYTSNETFQKKYKSSQDSSDPVYEKQTKYGKSYSDGELAKRKKCPCFNIDPDFELPSKCLCILRDGLTFDDKDPKTLDFNASNRRTFPRNTTISEFSNHPRQTVVGIVSKPMTTDKAMNTSLSDLSDLYKVIESHFNSTCQDPTHKKLRRQVPKVDCSTNTEHYDSPKTSHNTYFHSILPKESKKLEDSTTQTTKPEHKPCKCHTKPDKPRYKPPVVDDKQQAGVLLCKICLKKINIVMVDVETFTDGNESIDNTDGVPKYHEKKKPASYVNAQNMTLESKPPKCATAKPERYGSIYQNPNCTPKPVNNNNSSSNNCKVINKTSSPRSNKPMSISNNNSNSNGGPARKSDVCKPETRNKTLPIKGSGKKLSSEHSSNQNSSEQGTSPSTSRQTNGTNRTQYNSSSKNDTNRVKRRPSTESKFTYAVTVSRTWPKELVNTLQGNSEFGSTPSRTCMKQKRNLEKEYDDSELDVPFEKKIKNEHYESNEYICAEHNYKSPDDKKFNENYYSNACTCYEYNCNTDDHISEVNGILEDKDYCNCYNFCKSSTNNSTYESAFVFNQPHGDLRKEIGFVWIPSGSTPRFVTQDIPIPVSTVKSVRSEEKLIIKNSQKNQKTYCSLLSIKKENDGQEEKPIQNLYPCSRYKSLTTFQPNKINYANGSIDLKLQSLRKSVMSDLELVGNKSTELSFPYSEEENGDEYADFPNGLTIENCENLVYEPDTRSYTKTQCSQTQEFQFPYHNQHQTYNSSEESCRSTDVSTSKSFNKFPMDNGNEQKMVYHNPQNSPHL